MLLDFHILNNLDFNIPGGMNKDTKNKIVGGGGFYETTLELDLAYGSA